MSVEKVSLKPGWVSSQGNLEMTENFIKIIKFFLWYTPCENVSSMSKELKSYGWENGAWKKGQLSSCILKSAGLESGINYAVAKSYEEMSTKESLLHFNNSFQDKRDENKVLILKGNGYTNILQLFFYIRCAIAHGRFRIYDEKVYVMEAVKKYKADYKVKARMVLKEETLLNWIDIIEGGPNELEKRLLEVEKTEAEQVIEIIKANPKISKNGIHKEAKVSNEKVRKMIVLLESEGRISKDKKSWIVKK